MTPQEAQKKAMELAEAEREAAKAQALEDHKKAWNEARAAEFVPTFDYDAAIKAAGRAYVDALNAAMDRYNERGREYGFSSRYDTPSGRMEYNDNP